MDFIYRPILPEELWRKYSLLELYPFDGGGGFINRSLLGSVDDREIRRKFLKGELSGTVSFPKMDFHRYERWRSIELSCWVNRFYLVACLGHAAWLENDRSLANLLKETMLHFLDTCPPPDDIEAHWERVKNRMTHDYNEKTYEEYSVDETDVEYIWYDFQPASRVLHFLHTIHFIWNLADFAPGELERLIEGVRMHGRILFRQESMLPDATGNHQAVRQIGLLHAAAAFDEDDETRQWKELALKRIAWHARNDFFENGVLFENSPSYHAFETWHGRDALAFARLFGMDFDAEAERRFALAGKALAAYRRPDGRTLVVNDAYPLLPDGLLESLGIDVQAQPKTSCLNPGGLAVWRGDRLYAALDVSSFTGRFSHYHGGKNALTVFLDNETFVDDPGCCNYDDPAFRACKQADVHSSMMVDGTPDALSFSLYGWDSTPTMQFDGWEGNRFDSTLVSSTPQWQGVSWRRGLICRDDSIEVEDFVSSDQSHVFELHFTLAPGIAPEKVQGGLLLKGRHGALKMFFDEALFTATVVDGENYQTDPALPVKQIRLATRNSAGFTSKIRFEAADKAE